MNKHCRQCRKRLLVFQYSIPISHFGNNATEYIMIDRKRSLYPKFRLKTWREEMMKERKSLQLHFKICIPFYGLYIISPLAF